MIKQYNDFLNEKNSNKITVNLTQEPVITVDENSPITNFFNKIYDEKISKGFNG